jgi:acyl homoserine lactone synthase
MLLMITPQNQWQHYDKLRQMHRLRKQIFVDQLGWQHANIRVDAGMEFDQFDNAAAHYLVNLNDQDRVTGATRLIPTTAPYLLGEVFPQIVEDIELPQQSHTWETSRYCADTDLAPKTIMGILAAGMLEFALMKGIQRYVSISDIRIELIIRRYGWNPRRLGNPIFTGTDTSAAEEFLVSWETYQKVCQKSGVSMGGVISNIHEFIPQERVA